MSGKGYISAEDPHVCAFCQKLDETRPYGPNDERICFECAQKDLKTTEAKMAAYLGFS